MATIINLESPFDGPLMQMLNLKLKLAGSFTQLEHKLTEKKSTTLSNITTLIDDYKRNLMNVNDPTCTETTVKESIEPTFALDPEVIADQNTSNIIISILKTYDENVLSAIDEVNGLFDMLALPDINVKTESNFDESGQFELGSIEVLGITSVDNNITYMAAAIPVPIKLGITRPKYRKLCTVCGKYVSQLPQHMRIHTREKPYSCILCDMSFSQNSTLTKHMRIHTGEKPYACEICRMKFSRKCTMTKHLRRHSTEKPYTCILCNSAFRQISSLTEHMRKHTGEKSFDCSICYKAFSARGSLTRHLKTHTDKYFS